MYVSIYYFKNRIILRVRCAVPPMMAATVRRGLISDCHGGCNEKGKAEIGHTSHYLFASISIDVAKAKRCDESRR